MLHLVRRLAGQSVHSKEAGREDFAQSCGDYIARRDREIDQQADRIDGRVTLLPSRRESNQLRQASFVGGPSAEDAVAVAPSDEYVYRPDARPIYARCPLEKGPPEPLHRRGVQAGRGDGLRIP